MHDLLGWLIDIESLYNRGYEIIDGLRFKNGAYINTGFRGTKGFGFDCSVRVDETNPDVSGYTNYQAIGATRNGMTYNANMFAAINGAYNSIIFATGNYTNAWNYNIGEEHFYEGKFVSGGSNYLKVDGKVIGGPFIVTWTQSNTANEDVCIAKNSVSETIMGIVNIYDASSNLVRKLLPSKRTTDGKFGYFDSLQGIFYPNVGGGTIEGIGSSDDEEWEWIFTKSTTNILRRNFPEKFGEIVAYAKRHPKIVPFINEDPMLVCSLGIEGLPIRIASNINGETCGYNTDFYTSNKIRCVVECSFFNDTKGYDNGIFGGGGWDSTLGGQLGSLSIRWDRRGGNPCALDYCTEKHWYGSYYTTLQYNTWYIIDFNNSRCIIKSENGDIINNKTNSPIYWTPGNEKIMRVLGGRGVRWKVGYVYDESDNLIKRVVPLIKNNKVCFIDTVEWVPYIEKVGNGDLSIAYYKDGIPWHPI